MWIELHSRTRFHPKTKKLARRLGIPKPHAIGYLTTLWMWVLDMAADGDLSSFDEEDIEDGAEWDGEPGIFVAALVVVGYLDEGPHGLAIHDWTDYATHLKAAERKRRERARKREGVTGRHVTSRDSHAESQDVTSSRAPDVTVTQTDRPDRPDRPDQTDRTGHTTDLDLTELEAEGATRLGLGRLGAEKEATAILEQLTPVSREEVEDAFGYAPRTWLYAAKAMRTFREATGRRQSAAREHQVKLDQEATERAAADGERFTGDVPSGLAKLAESLGLKKGIT